jgi:hypothetical protein
MKKLTTRKRYIALFLALVMSASMLTAFASAANVVPDEAENPITVAAGIRVTRWYAAGLGWYAGWEGIPAGVTGVLNINGAGTSVTTNGSKFIGGSQTTVPTVYLVVGGQTYYPS